jgi:hypothetical protein
MLALILAAVASAASPAYPVTLTGGLGAGLGPTNNADQPFAPPSAGGFGDGHLVIYPGHSPVGIDISSRDGYFVSDGRMLGGIALEARVPTATGLYFTGGFVHHHETPMDVAKGAPMGSMMGSANGIRHRSGLGLGLGYDLVVPDRTLDDRLGIAFDLSGAVFPDDNGPAVYGFFETAVTLDLGKRRS